MRRYASRKPTLRYRFKDEMNCVFFKNFYTKREAMVWYEAHKVSYLLKSFSCVGTIY